MPECGRAFSQLGATLDDSIPSDMFREFDGDAAPTYAADLPSTPQMLRGGRPPSDEDLHVVRVRAFADILLAVVAGNAFGYL